MDRVREFAKLSAAGRSAFLDGLTDLPDDYAEPAPLCERITLVQALLARLSLRVDLPAADRAVFRGWLDREGSLVVCAAIVGTADAIARIARMRSLPPQRSIGLMALSEAGSRALSAALQAMPWQNEAPIAERVAWLLDAIVPLTERADLPEADHAILFALCTDDDRLKSFAHAITVAGLPRSEP